MTYESNSDGTDAVARRIAGLPPEKRALFEKMLRDRQAQEERGRRIPCRPEGQPAPLSFSQQRVWFFEQLEPGTTVYNGPMSYRIRAFLDVDAMCRAFAALLNRHESLRTVIVSEGGEPTQRVEPAGGSRLAFEDLSGLPPEAALAKAIEMATAQRNEAFRFDSGSLIRARLLRLGADDHVLLMTLHHIIFDGWSIGVLVRDLRELYRAEVTRTPSTLPVLPISYGDFCVWQRGPAAQAEFQSQADFWKRQLSGIAPLDLPLDVVRPALQTFRGDSRRLVLSETLTQAVRSLAQREGVTLFMLLLGAWGAQLARLAGQRDVVIGTPVAGRRHEETENLVGFFVNTLSMRLDASGNPSFAELLGRARQTASAAFANQELPFEQVVAGHGGQRDASRTPIFQVMLNFFNFSVEGAGSSQASELPMEGFPARDGQISTEIDSKFDLTLYGLEQGSSLQLALAYNRDLFTGVRIEGMLSQLVSFLEQATARPTVGIDSLSLLTPGSVARLPSAEVRPAALEEGLGHSLFELAADRYPDRIAIEDSLRGWTYREVDEVSGRIARWLRGAGVAAGDCVALHFDRSAALAIAVLGVLRSGAAFVILDPSYPDARLASYWRAVAPRALIRGSSIRQPDGLLAQLAADVPQQLSIALDGTLSVEVPAQPEPVSFSITPDTTAYFAFTSGSSGRPKAVVGTHRPLGHFLRWHIETHAFRLEDRFSMLSGLAHDPILRDILTPLSIGATLVVPPEDAAGPASWGPWLREQSISVCHLTPPLGRLLLQGVSGLESDGSTGAKLASLRYAFFGGDALLREDVRRLRSLAPEVNCVVFYGATETPQAMAFHRVGDEELLQGKPERLPIGRGIDGVDLLVMNASGHLAGVGEPGEIQVRTPYLSMGYLGDPEGTLERFTSFGTVGLPRFGLYRTGDLGRYRPDGTVDFLGRSDQQVKVRGFRVELGEVTAVLSGCAGVQQAVVVPRADASDSERLVGYFVPAVKPPPGQDLLRRTMLESLPDYMVPSVFVVLEGLPLTPNGKLDLRALPQPGESGPSPSTTSVEPSGSLEIRVAEVWKEVLGVSRVGVDDNFFDLGGHSLLVVRLHQRLSSVLETKPTLLDLFKHPTVRRLVRHLENGAQPSAPPTRSLAERASQRTRALDRQREHARRNRSS